MYLLVSRFRLLLITLLVFLQATTIFAIDEKSVGTLEEIVVHSKSIESNLMGESPDRDVTVYLPPSYSSESEKRYPVIYLLHGYGNTNKTWNKRDGKYDSLKSVMDEGIAEGRFGEMIVVMPNEYTKLAGSFYTNSPTTGNWEDFTTVELVSYIDSHYRTIAKVGSRGIAGHSMGGYGALTLGMKHPDVFSVVYGLNPALIGWARDISIENPAFESLDAFSTVEELYESESYALVFVSIAQAFSPNPDNPPFYMDLPFEKRDGHLLPKEDAFQKWTEHMAVSMVDSYADNLRKLRGFRFDSGNIDQFTHIPVTTKELSDKLTNYGIDHIFEMYNGDHRNRLWGRTGRMFNEVFPYFWLLLDSQ